MQIKTMTQEELKKLTSWEKLANDAALGIQSGRFYKLRNGSVVGPIVENARDARWRWSFQSDSYGWCWWLANGAWSKDSPSAMDIVEEYDQDKFIVDEPERPNINAPHPDTGTTSPSPRMTKHRLLDLAREATADRGLNYGKPEDNFARIAMLWNAHLCNRGIIDVTVNGFVLTPGDVAMMCALLKVARLQHQPGHQDSWVDLAGYAACGAEIELAPKAKMPLVWSSLGGLPEAVAAGEYFIDPSGHTYLAMDSFHAGQVPWLDEKKLQAWTGPTKVKTV